MDTVKVESSMKAPRLNKDPKRGGEKIVKLKAADVKRVRMSRMN